MRSPTERTMEPVQTITQILYSFPRSSLQYAHWRSLSSPGQNGTSCEIFAKESDNLRKNPSLRLCSRCKTPPPAHSDPRSGLNTTASCTTEAASTSRHPPNSTTALSPSVMILRWLDILTL